MREEFISQALALGCAFYKPCNVNEFDNGRGNLFTCVKSRQLIQPFVGYGNDADVRVNGAERIIRAFRACVCDCVKKSRFTNVGKSNDAEYHRNSFLLSVFLLYYNTKFKFWQIKRARFEKILAQIKKICYISKDKNNGKV